MAGLMESLAAAPYRGQADLPALAATLQMEVDDLFPIAETLQLLRFAEMAEGDIRLTDAGRRYADADVDERKQLFAQHLLAYVPLAGHIRRVLDERASTRRPASRFRDELEDYMSEELRRPDAEVPSSSGAATARSSPTTRTTGFQPRQSELSGAARALTSPLPAGSSRRLTAASVQRRKSVVPNPMVSCASRSPAR